MMTKLFGLFFLLSLLLAPSGWAQLSRSGRPTATPAPVKAPAPAPVRANPFAQRSVAVENRPAVNNSHSAIINMNPPASGPVNTSPVYYPPAYGQLQWINQSAPPPDQSAPPQVSAPPPENVPTPGEEVPTPTPASSAKVVHHHPYTPGYIRKKLQKIGVKTSPGYIVDRKELMATDRDHSTLTLPKKGPDGKKLTAQAISPRDLSNKIVLSQMTLVNDPAFLRKLLASTHAETKTGRYYWHKEDHCFHTVDRWGYHWYGWYLGNHYFWTRYYGGRWWTYDSDYSRWVFWHDGFWWWQDPHHVGDLYCYTSDAYIPCNSANDTIRVTTVDEPGASQYLSSDKGRMVKVVGQAQDAFLYDTTADPAFGPIYLASGVKGVEFSSDPSGPNLQIVLKINDGSFDMLDGDGNPYNSGVTDVEPPGPHKAASPSPAQH